MKGGEDSEALQRETTHHLDGDCNTCTHTRTDYRTEKKTEQHLPPAPLQSRNLQVISLTS